MPKPKRSIKKKLFIVFSFVFVLAITPTLIYTLLNLDLSKSKEVSMANPETQSTEANSSPEVHKVYIEEAKDTSNQTTVLNNDSYYKITKRVCGQGNNYQFVQEQNDSKPLHVGDTVTVDCNL